MGFSPGKSLGCIKILRTPIYVRKRLRKISFYQLLFGEHVKLSDDYVHTHNFVSSSDLASDNIYYPNSNMIIIQKYTWFGTCVFGLLVCFYEIYDSLDSRDLVCYLVWRWPWRHSPPFRGSFCGPSSIESIVSNACHGIGFEIMKFGVGLAACLDGEKGRN